MSFHGARGSIDECSICNKAHPKATNNLTEKDWYGITICNPNGTQCIFNPHKLDCECDCHQKKSIECKPAMDLYPYEGKHRFISDGMCLYCNKEKSDD